MDRYVFSNTDTWYFHELTGDLESSLLELFSTEYAIGELKMRAHQNPRLVNYDTMTARRFKHWKEKFEEHALGIALEVAPTILQELHRWLSSHTTSGFADMAMGMDEEMDEVSSIDEDGILWLGWPAFSFNMIQPTVKTFCQLNEWFADQYIADEEQSREEDSAYSEEEYEPLNLSDEEKANYVAEQIMDIGYDWQSLRSWLEQLGDFDQAVKQVLTEIAFPQWRQYWGLEIIGKAEDDVRAAIERLEQAINSEKLNDLLIAINVALNTKHVHGKMSMHMDVGEATLNQLSNLDTDAIDTYLDEIVTGPNWKRAYWEELQDVALKVASMDVEAVLKQNAKLAAYSLMHIEKIDPLEKDEEFARAMRVQREEILRYQQEMAQEGRVLSDDEAAKEWIMLYAKGWREMYNRAKERQLVGTKNVTFKTAQSRKLERMDYYVPISDTDRYTTDRYDLLLSLREFDDGHLAIGFQVNSTQLGVTSGCIYWSYDSSEKAIARRSYHRIKTVVKKTYDEIESGCIKFTLIGPLFRSRLAQIDYEHLEPTGIWHYNMSLLETIEPDWTKTIYGLRYPAAIHSNNPQELNADDISRSIISSGKNSRNRIYHFDYENNHPQKPDYPKRRLKAPPPRFVPPFDSRQSDIFAKKGQAVQTRSQAKSILNEVVSEFGPEINFLEPLARNKLWNHRIAPALRERGTPSSWLSFLHSVFSAWGQTAYAAKSRKWKIAYSVL